MLAFRSLLLCFLVGTAYAERPAADASGHAAPRHMRVVWTKTPATHAIISWTSLAPVTDQAVHYDTQSRGGRLDAYANRVAADRFGRITLRAEDRAEGVPPGWFHHVELNSLQPATRYYFVVAGGGGVSPERYFVTAPADDRPFKILSGGDSRMGGPKPHYAGRTPHIDRQAMNRRMTQLLEQQPDIIALAHGADWCTSADWRHLYWWFEDNDRLVTEDGRLLPLIVSRGNHDEGIGFQENFWLGDITDQRSSGYYYRTTLGTGTVLLTLNSEISVAGDQREWLEEELDEIRPAHRWVLAQYHRPAYPAVKAFEGDVSPRIRQNWVPLFEQYNVDLVLESDGHSLKRTVPIRDNAPAADGVVYIGEGGLGVPQRKPRQDHWYLQAPGFTTSAHHVWLLSFDANTLRMQAIGVDGAVIDEHQLSARAALAGIAEGAR